MNYIEPQQKSVCSISETVLVDKILKLITPVHTQQLQCYQQYYDNICGVNPNHKLLHYDIDLDIG